MGLAHPFGSLRRNVPKIRLRNDVLSNASSLFVFFLYLVLNYFENCHHLHHYPSRYLPPLSLLYQGLSPLLVIWSTLQVCPSHPTFSLPPSIYSLSPPCLFQQPLQSSNLSIPPTTKVTVSTIGPLLSPSKGSLLSYGFHNLVLGRVVLEQARASYYHVCRSKPFIILPSNAPPSLPLRGKFALSTIWLEAWLYDPAQPKPRYAHHDYYTFNFSKRKDNYTYTKIRLQGMFDQLNQDCAFGCNSSGRKPFFKSKMS